MLSRRSLLCAGLIVTPSILRAAPTSKDIDIIVTQGTGTRPRGPQPLPSPYPLQPGFTAITDLAMITDPGNYQMMTDGFYIGYKISLPAGVTIDFGGRIAGTEESQCTINGPDCSILNANIKASSFDVQNGDNLFIINSSVRGGVTVRTGGNNILIQNCLFEGPYPDDSFIVYDIGNAPLSRGKFYNNIFRNAPIDMGIEFVHTSMDNWEFINNQFENISIGMGDFQVATRTNNVFRGNRFQRGSVYRWYGFDDMFTDNDETARAWWGPSGNVFEDNDWF